MTKVLNPHELPECMIGPSEPCDAFTIMQRERDEYKQCAEVEAKLRREAHADLATARKLIDPLLDHYLNCYKGNADQLVWNTRAFLERAANLVGK